MHKSRHIAADLSLAFGVARDVLMGIAQYAQARQGWQIRTNPPLRGFPLGPIHAFDGDGVITGLLDEAETQALAARGVPVVYISEIADKPPMPAVLPDARAIARMAADHMWGMGIRNFAVAGNTRRHRYGKQMLAAFREALARLGHDQPVPEQETFTSYVEWADDMARLENWLRGLPKPVGIFATEDRAAGHVVEACGRIGLAVPDEVAVLGVGNDPLQCEMLKPALSAIRVDGERIGYEAARMLESLMEGAPAPTEPVLIAPVEVVQRTSTDVLAIDDPVVARAVRYIRENVSDGIAVRDVVDQLGHSRKSLENRFAKALGHGPGAEISRTRLLRAKTMLRRTGLPVSAIAADCGYSDQTRLGVAFKRDMGLTPTQFRKRTHGHEQGQFLPS